MAAVIIAAPAPIFIDTSQGTPGFPSPTGGVMTVQGQTGMYPVTVINQGAVGITGPVGVTGSIQVTQPTGPNLQAQIQGLGLAGGPTGGVLTIQGVTGGTEIPIVENDNTTTGVLGALNASVPLLLAGTTSIGFQLAAGTLIGTIVPEVSFDGGITWNATFFDNPSTSNKVSSIVFSAANTATGSTIVGVGGAGFARVRVSAYTSGTANCTVRSSQMNDPSALYAGAAGATGANPPTVAQVGGIDSLNTLRALTVLPGPTGPITTNPAAVVIISPNQAAVPVTITSAATATPGIAPGYITTTSKTNVAVQASTYNEQSANFTGSIKSASTNDTSAGTGARTVIITYVDSTGATAGTETATMNGTTAVNLVTTTKCFIEKITVATVGTAAGSNAGAITLFTGAAGAGTAVAIINAADNLTFLGHHYVVTGKTCHVTDYTGTTNSSNESLFSIQAVTIPVATEPSIQISDWVNGAQGNQVQRTFTSTSNITGPARLQLFAAPGATASITSYGSFTFYDQ